MRFPLRSSDLPTLRYLADYVIQHRVPASRLVRHVDALTGVTREELSAPVRELVVYIGSSFINAGPDYVAALLRLFAQDSGTQPSPEIYDGLAR